MKEFLSFLTSDEVQYVTFGIVGLLLWWLLVRFQHLLSRRLKNLSSRVPIAGLMSDALSHTSRLLLGAVAFLAASNVLDLPDAVRFWSFRILVLLLIIQAGIWLSRLSGTFAKRLLALGDQDPSSTHAALSLAEFGLRLIVWIAVFLLVLDNLGINVTALVAGLGIGGVAIALAVQNILGDLFASLTIILDKPFEVGDFIFVGELGGTVERVGIKTTRIKSLSGEQLVFSNADLIGSRVKNYKRMLERRVVFTLDLDRNTPPSHVLSAVNIVKEAIQAQEKTRLDRVHFKGFGPSSLQLEAVYFVLSPEYNLYMDIQQIINLNIMERYLETNINFAFPTQALFIRQENKSEEQPQ